MKEKLSHRLESRHRKIELQKPVCRTPSRFITDYQMASNARPELLS